MTVNLDLEPSWLVLPPDSSQEMRTALWSRLTCWAAPDAVVRDTGGPWPGYLVPARYCEAGKGPLKLRCNAPGDEVYICAPGTELPVEHATVYMIPERAWLTPIDTATCVEDGCGPGGEEPEAPTALDSPTQTETTIDLTWLHSGVQPLDGFRLHHRVSGDPDWTLTRLEDPLLRARTLTGLTPDTSYDIKLEAYAMADTELISTPAGPTTISTLPAPLPQPTAFAKTGPDPAYTEFQLEWDYDSSVSALAATIDGFTLAYRVTGDTGAFTEVDVPDPAARTGEITGLDADTSYDLTLTAYRTAGDLVSPPATLTESTDALPVVEAPAGLDSPAQAPVSIDLAWTHDGTEPLDGFRVQYRTPPGSGDWTDEDVDDATARTHTLTGLSPETSYEIQLLATATVEG